MERATRARTAAQMPGRGDNAFAAESFADYLSRTIYVPIDGQFVAIPMPPQMEP